VEWDQERSFAGFGPGGFSGFITGDRNLSFQQNLPNFSIAVVVLEAESIRLVHTRPLMSKLLSILPSIKAGQIVTLAP
jgi:hypothetical protein